MRYKDIAIAIVALILVILSHQGYWISGHENTIELSWNLREAMPAAHVQWELRAGPVVLSKGTEAMAPDRGARIRIVAPQVRVRSAITFSYRAISDADQREVASGEARISVFPSSVVSEWGQALKQRQIGVYDPHDSLARAFADSPLKLTRLTDLSKLEPSDVDVILVGQGAIDQDAISQSQLLRCVAAGMSAVVFPQGKMPELAGYPVHLRRMDDQVKWRNDHRLFSALMPEDLPTLAPPSSREVACLSLPADDAGIALANWPGEPGDASRVDAVVAIKGIGAGRIILWQLPLEDWAADARARIILRNALEYAASGANTDRESKTGESTNSATKPAGPKGKGR